MTYLDIIKDFDSLRSQLDRAFNADAWRQPFSRFSFLPALGARRYPMINISGDKDNVYVEALAPGVNADALDVTVQNNVLTISGEKQSVCEEVESESYHRCERAAGKFIRTVELNTEVDEDKVSAEYKNGILLITLPRSEAAKPKKIAIIAG